MRILLVDAHDPDDRRRRSADTAAAVLAESGHDLRRVDLVADGFTPYLSPDERRAYHDQGANVLADEVGMSVDGVLWAEGLVFCYPTTTFTVPAVLKAWMERVLLPGVTFDFDSKGRVVRNLTNVRRLAVVTTTPHSRWATARARDSGRRSLLRAVRLSCARTCRRTFVAVRGDDDEAAIRRALARW